MTITEAIRRVIHQHGAPMTFDEAYRAIIEANLYEFHSDKPAHIVRTQIRRHCQGIDYPSTSPIKYFKLIGENRYWPLKRPVRLVRNPRHEKTASKRLQVSKVSVSDSLAELQDLHKHYISKLKKNILADLKRLSPAAFEAFAKRLLDVYGFHDTEVTQVLGTEGLMGMVS